MSINITPKTETAKTVVTQDVQVNEMRIVGMSVQMVQDAMEFSTVTLTWHVGYFDTDNKFVMVAEKNHTAAGMDAIKLINAPTLDGEIIGRANERIARDYLETHGLV